LTRGTPIRIPAPPTPHQHADNATLPTSSRRSISKAGMAIDGVHLSFVWVGPFGHDESPRSERNRIAHGREPWEARRRFLGQSPRSGRNRIAHGREPWEPRRRFLGQSPRSGRNSLSHAVSRENSFDWEATASSERVSSRLTPRDILFRPLPRAWCTGGLAFPSQRSRIGLFCFAHYRGLSCLLQPRRN
jgi:hypothetical protein